MTAGGRQVRVIDLSLQLAEIAALPIEKHAGAIAPLAQDRRFVVRQPFHELEQILVAMRRLETQLSPFKRGAKGAVQWSFDWNRPARGATDAGVPASVEGVEGKDVGVHLGIARLARTPHRQASPRTRQSLEWLVPEPLPYRATALGAPYTDLARLPVSVMLDNVRSAYNVGAFFRTLEAVGAERLYLAGITPTPTHRGVAKTALGAESTLPWTAAGDPVPLLEDLDARGAVLAAVETSNTAVDLFDWRPAFPVCLIFGHEVSGVSPAILERVSVHVRIPMLGRKQSLNVATAGGVVLYELLRKFRELHAPR
jgi:23S rRNA (guanosine2251-2'-O)-methyltransferase